MGAHNVPVNLTGIPLNAIRKYFGLGEHIMESNRLDRLKETLYTRGVEYTMEATKIVEYDMVNHPKHYQSKSGLEVIDVIEAFTDGLNGIEASDTANIIKYACRWKDKNGVEDLRKIAWYANHLANYLEKK